jgi:transposase
MRRRSPIRIRTWAVFPGFWWLRQVRPGTAHYEHLRTLLVECANHILGPFGKDSALRRWGLHLMERGGRSSKKKALVAVARKLAVLLHRLWVTQEQYSPFFGQQAA